MYNYLSHIILIIRLYLAIINQVLNFLKLSIHRFFKKDTHINWHFLTYISILNFIIVIAVLLHGNIDFYNPMSFDIPVQHIRGPLTEQEQDLRDGRIQALSDAIREALLNAHIEEARIEAALIEEARIEAARIEAERMDLIIAGINQGLLDISAAPAELTTLNGIVTAGADIIPSQPDIGGAGVVIFEGST